MRGLQTCAILLLLTCSPSWAQEKNEPPPKPAPEGGQTRPTLGPAPAPSLSGPRSFNTTDSRRLLRVRKIFVQRIDNLLSDKLIAGLAKDSRFRIVLDEKEADAVLRGSCLDSHRLKAVHSEVFLSDRATGTSIWQDNVRKPFNPPVLEKAVDDSATTIVEHLNESIQDAQRK